MNNITRTATAPNLAAVHHGLPTTIADKRLALSAYRQGNSHSDFDSIGAIADRLLRLLKQRNLVASLDRNLANPHTGTLEPLSGGR